MSEELEDDFIGIQDALNATRVLGQIMEEDYARIPEPIFVQHVLPELTKPNGNLGVWQMVAGHLFRPLLVFDPNTKEELFKFPPPLQQLSKTINARGPDAPSEIAMTALQKNKIIPRSGEYYLYEKLTHRLGPVNQDYDRVKIWNDVFKRYGYDPILPEDKKESKKDENHPMSPEDSLLSNEYEDL